MVITFGLNSDGARDIAASLDASWVGEQKMLTLLETQLGMPADQASYTDRLVQYLECLEGELGSTPFYSKSFAVAPIATAATLLAWRDQLFMGGWDGGYIADASPRLATIAEVEKTAVDLVGVNFGQRLQRVISALDDQKVRIAEIRLRDELELLPPLWQKLLCTLRDMHGVSLIDESIPEPHASEHSDLGRLQRVLLQPGATEKITINGDGSLALVHAPSAQLVSYSLAQLIAGYHEVTEKLPVAAILAEQNGRMIDAAFESNGIPRVGFSNLSPWRPAAQVLQLAFELMWEPLDPHAQVQFLTHPVGPLSSRLKSKLAELVAETPGMGSERWQEIIDAEVETVAKGDPEKAVALRERIQQWLAPARYAPEAGMPIEVALERAELVAHWLQRRHASEVEDAKDELSHFALALRQVQDLINALNRLLRSGKAQIGREELRLLIGQTRGSGIDLIDRCAEAVAPANPLLALENPATMSASQDLVVWTGLEPVPSLKRPPWLPNEEQILTEAGVQLWPQEHELKLQAHHWMLPLLSACQQLILLPQTGADGHHPVLDLIASKLEGGLESLNPITATDVLLGAKPIGVLGVPISADTSRVPALPLPTKQRWWKLNDINLPKRDAESFSSLDQFIKSPYQWVFRYQARINSGALAQVQDERRLKGNLAHMLFEQFFTEHTDIASINDSAIEGWCEQALYELLPLAGSTMLLPGHRVERERFLGQCARALRQLCGQLQAGKVDKVKMESSQVGDFIGGELRGSIDLLATQVDGSEAVIDIKWSGYNYRKNSWEKGDYLQLLTYAQLRRQKTGKIPALAYFIVDASQLLTNNLEYFPIAQVIPEVDNLAIADYWKQLEDTWKWRREQIQQGRVEVTVSGTEPTEDSQPGTGLQIPEASDTFNDYAALTGWGEDA